jgi:hypothetical protein
MYHRVAVSEDYARPYIRRALGSGHVLASALLDRVSRGDKLLAEALLPDPAEFDRLTQFEQSIGASYDASTHLASEIIADRLELHPGEFLVLEDPQSSPGDPWLAEAETEVVCGPIAVYHIPKSSSPGDIKTAIFVAGQYYVVGAIGPASVRIDGLTELPDPAVRQIAQATPYFIVDAYDAEAILLCTF